ncbi:MAG: hypothetical protein KJ062_20530 [Thermoanaerobaculia bacterium]|nr:hypothetical protein [Thermoanaerobaculia bacterium]
MRKPWIVLLLLAGTGPFLGGCGAREEARPTPPPAVEIAPATNAETEAPLEPVESRPPATPAPETAATDVAGPVGTVVPAPRPDPTRAVPAKAPAAEPARAATPSRVATTPPTPPPPPATPPTVAPAPTRAAPSGLVDPGGEIVVPPGKAGVTRVGVDKCKVCHKVQHASWAASGHAKRMPPLDCEGCHGPGSEYRAMAVMKDPAKARAAGLVEPDAGFCARCHSGTADRAFFAKVHAHKTAP